MRKRVLAFGFMAGLLAAAAVPGVVSAHNAGPCNDTDGDGVPSGHDYAAHHIVAAAKAGALGNDGHKPGSHMGFSLCLGVHD